MSKDKKDMYVNFIMDLAKEVDKWLHENYPFIAKFGSSDSIIAGIRKKHGPQISPTTIKAFVREVALSCASNGVDHISPHRSPDPSDAVIARICNKHIP